MSRSRIQIAPHFNLAELTQHYEECQDIKTKNYWLMILLLSHPKTPLTIEQAAQQLDFSPDWVRKIVRRYNQFGSFELGKRRVGRQ